MANESRKDAGDRDPRRPGQGRHGGGAQGQGARAPRHPDHLPLGLADGPRRPAAEQPRHGPLGDPAGARLRRPGLRGDQDPARADPRGHRRAADRRRDPATRPTSRPPRLVGADRTVLLDIRETVAKLVVQTSRQSGAAAVYTELFDYDGDEIYFLEEHGLAGSTYAEAQLAFEAASVIGMVDGGGVEAQPAGGHRRSPEQTLIVVAEDDSALEGQSRSMTEPALNQLASSARDRGPADPGAADRLERAGADRAPRARPLRAARLHADRADGVRRARRAGAARTSPSRWSRRPPPTGRSSRSTSVADLDQIIVLCYDRRPRRPGGRLAHAGHAAARARHPAPGRLGDPGGQRDDRRPQPGARLGRRRRRHRGQRRDRLAAGHPALRGRPARGGLRASCSVPRAARSTCGPPSGTSSRATRSAGPPSWPARRGATRRAIGLKSALLAEPATEVRGGRQPAEVADLHDRRGRRVVVLAED